MSAIRERFIETPPDVLEYLEQHKVEELLVELGSCIYHSRPDNIEEFLINQLKQRREGNAHRM